jgi:hypothetical protein
MCSAEIEQLKKSQAAKPGGKLLEEISHPKRIMNLQREHMTLEDMMTRKKMVTKTKKGMRWKGLLAARKMMSKRRAMRKTASKRTNSQLN